MNRLSGSLLALSILFGSVHTPVLAQEKALTVFAAASMKNALDDVDAAYTAKTGVKVTASYAASSVLAKQIEQGAPPTSSSPPTPTGWTTPSRRRTSTCRRASTCSATASS